MNIKLLENLDFAGKINATEAVSEAGKEMVRNYKGYMFNNHSTCSIVNSFVAEAQNYGFDTGINATLNSILGFINENKISWKLASVCESISNNNSQYNYIAKLGVEQVQKLLEMDEANVVSYIKAGSLKNIQYIPEFRAICKEVYKSTINEVYAPTYTVVNPISYVNITESKDQYFSVLGKTYKISDNKVCEATCDDTTFNRINLLLESFKNDGENIYYEMKGAHGDVIKFTVTESTLNLTNGSTINETFNSPVEFMEYANTASKVMNMNEKVNWMKVTSAISEVFEAAERIVALDCVNVMTCADGSVCAIVEAKDNVNLTVFRSVNAGTSCNNYDYVIEALKQVTKVTGVDLKNLYESRIDEDCKKQNPDEYQVIKEELDASRTAKMDIRKKKIAMLAEQYKNDPAKIMLLNKAARDLALLG